MSNTTYISVPGSQPSSDEQRSVATYTSTPQNWYDAPIKSHVGAIDFDMGTPLTWTQDVKWPIKKNSNPNINEGIIIEGDNSKDHLAIYCQLTGVDGLFPSMRHINGFEIDWVNNSTAGSAMYLKKIGIETCKGDGSVSHRWSTENHSPPGNYDKKTMGGFFSKDDMAKFANDYFYRLWFQISSETSGPGSRTTQVTLGNFKLLYNVGSKDNRWIVGKYRKKEVAFSESIQGK